MKNVCQWLAVCADVLVHLNSLCSNRVLDKYVCDFYILMYAWVYTHEYIRTYVTVCVEGTGQEQIEKQSLGTAGL